MTTGSFPGDRMQPKCTSGVWNVKCYFLPVRHNYGSKEKDLLRFYLGNLFLFLFFFNRSKL